VLASAASERAGFKSAAEKITERKRRRLMLSGEMGGGVIKGGRRLILGKDTHFHGFVRVSSGFISEMGSSRTVAILTL